MKLGQALRLREDSLLMPVKDAAVKGCVTVTVFPSWTALSCPRVNRASPPAPLFQTCQLFSRSPG